MKSSLKAPKAKQWHGNVVFLFFRLSLCRKRLFDHRLLDGRLEYVLASCVTDYRCVARGWARGVRAPSDLADQLTLFKPESADFAPHTTASPPGFKKLSTPLDYRGGLFLFIQQWTHFRSFARGNLCAFAAQYFCMLELKPMLL